MTFKPVLLATPTTNEADSAAGLDLDLHAPQSLGAAPTPSPIRSAILTLPPGLTINPDAADGQSACTDAQANFGTEAAGRCPDNAKIGTFAIGSPALDGPLNGSIYIGEPKPGDQYRLFMVADGFGIHAKLVGSFQPDPQTGQVTADFDDLPAGSVRRVRPAPLRLRPRPDGDPDPLHALPDRRPLLPLERRARRRQTSTQFFSIDSGPGGAAARARCAPSTRASSPAPPTRSPAPSRDFP